jgi:hypothetical protein
MRQGQDLHHAVVVFAGQADAGIAHNTASKARW